MSEGGMDMNRSNFESEREFLEKKTAEIVEALKEKPVIKEAFQRLEKELPENLRYHDKNHSYEVMHDAVFLAVADGLSEREMEIIGVEAAWHDAGFIEKPGKNEAIGSLMAIEAMRKDGGYSEEEIKLVSDGIEDTEVRMTENGLNQIEKGRNKLADYLLDADVGNFGREDFMDKTKLVAREAGVDVSNPAAYRQFLGGTLKFVKNHEWKTEAAKKWRSGQKENNVKRLLAEIGN